MLLERLEKRNRLRAQSYFGHIRAAEAAHRAIVYGTEAKRRADQTPEIPRALSPRYIKTKAAVRDHSGFFMLKNARLPGRGGDGGRKGQRAFSQHLCADLQHIEKQELEDDV
jgi:hypothetical protein